MMLRPIMVAVMVSGMVMRLHHVSAAKGTVAASNRRAFGFAGLSRTADARRAQPAMIPAAMVMTGPALTAMSNENPPRSANSPRIQLVAMTAWSV